MQSTRQSQPAISPSGSDGKPNLASETPKRKMSRSELCGLHTHVTQHGQQVHIYERDGQFLARARWQCQQIGQSLGCDPNAAGHSLRRMLTEMENGTYVPPSKVRSQRFPTSLAPRHDLRSLINIFLDDRQKLRGKKTARNYANRLMHVLDFAELPKSKKTWPFAKSINREFALQLKGFLFDREVTRNGKSGGTQKSMSVGMIRMCLEALRTTLCWAARADVRQLPAEFVNPINREILGPKPQKDPLRENPVPIDHRIQMVHQMDAWQLCHLTPSLILPIRFEDVAGALISDFDLKRGTWNLGTRLQGNDFNKGRMNIRMPLPKELCSALKRTVGDRMDGPMFLSRADWEGRPRKRLKFSSLQQFADLCEHELCKARPTDVATDQDRKTVIRSLLSKCGAVSSDAIGRGIHQLYDAAGIPKGTRPYDLRAAVTTDMHNSGLRHLEMRYLTEHSVNDILNEYTSLDPAGEMAKYFQRIAPLLSAIRHRAAELGILNSKDSNLESHAGGA